MSSKNFGFYNKKSPNRSHLDPGISLLIHRNACAGLCPKAYGASVQAGLLTPGSFDLQRLPDP
jgi:hypothetical protein